MNNVIPLRRRNSPGIQHHARAAESFDLSFWIGVVVWVVLPDVIFSSYFGILMAGTLATCALAGGCLGLGIYIRFPYQIQSCIPSLAVEAPARKFATSKAA